MPWDTYTIDVGETTPSPGHVLVTIYVSDDMGRNTAPRTLRITATATNDHGIVQSTQVLTVTVTDDE